MESSRGGDQVSIDVSDAPPRPPTPPSSSWFSGSFPFLLRLYVFALLYLFDLALVRSKFKDEKQSSFKTHAGLMIISFVSLFVSALATGVLFYAQKYLQSSKSDTHYNILEVISYFSGLLAPLCLLLVFVGLPKNLIWIGYLVICVSFMIVVVCYFTNCMRFFIFKSDDVPSLQPDEVIEDENCSLNYSLIFLPLPIVLMLYVPSNLDWIRYSVYGITFVAVVAYNIFACMKTVKKKKAPKLEARQVAQQENRIVI